jgi:hypothetical protein
MPLNFGPLEQVLAVILCLVAVGVLAGLVGAALRRTRVQEGHGRVGGDTPSPSLADELVRLDAQRRSGVLSEEEFETAKRRLLG